MQVNVKLPPAGSQKGVKLVLIMIQAHLYGVEFLKF
jgi:hypothetical protein